MSSSKKIRSFSLSKIQKLPCFKITSLSVARSRLAILATPIVVQYRSSVTSKRKAKSTRLSQIYRSEKQKRQLKLIGRLILPRESRKSSRKHRERILQLQGRKLTGML